jgi:hypothetical protein
MPTVQALNASIASWYPGFDPSTAFPASSGLAKMLPVVPPLSERVRVFASNSDLVAYMKSATYGRNQEDKAVYAAIILNAQGPDWDYAVRTWSPAGTTLSYHRLVHFAFARHTPAPLPCLLRVCAAGTLDQFRLAATSTHPRTQTGAGVDMSPPHAHCERDWSV